MLYFASFCISAKLVKNGCDVRTDMQARRYSHRVHITEQVSQKKNSITKHNRLTQLFCSNIVSTLEVYPSEVIFDLNSIGQ